MHGWTFDMKKTLALLLILSVVLSVLLPIAPQAQAADAWDADNDADGSLTILTIGNSFSEDTLAYVYEIASELGVPDIFLGNLIAQEGTLVEHWENADTDKAAYTYCTNGDGEWKSQESYKMSDALTSCAWDYVVLQQESSLSGVESTYNDDLTNLVGYVKSLCPSAKLAWNMTWAYQEDSEKLESSVCSDQLNMHHSIVSAAMNKIDTNPDFDKIVPLSAAVQNIRTSLLGDNICEEDGYRLERSFGRYLAGLTFVGAITGVDIWECNWTPETVAYALQIISMESASNAISNPFAITYSQHPDPETSLLYSTSPTKSQTAPSNDDFYARIYPQWTKGAYWRTEDRDDTSSVVKNVQKSPCYWATLRYSSSYLPVGSVIIQNDAFHYRIEKWSTSNPNGKQSSRGPVKTDTQYVIKAADWSGIPDKDKVFIS